MTEKMEFIPPKSPEFIIQIGEKAVSLTWDNSRLYLFPERYAYMNHLYIPHDDEPEEAICMFGNAKMFKKMFKNSWPTTFAPYPNEQDREVYMSYTTSTFDEEWDEYNKGEQDG